jgi:ribonuclease J
LKPLDIHEVEKEDTVKVGGLRVRFFSVSHTIPDAMGIIIETPYGLMVFTGDLRLDHMDGIPSELEEKEFGYFKDKKVLFLAADSTNVEKPGFSIPERTVQRNLDDIITNTNSRLIIGTFSSQLERIMRMLEAAERAGKKVLVEGRSMKVNIEIVKQLGMLKVSDKTFIDAAQLEHVPESKTVILGTGAQGDEFAALMRIAMKTHKNVKIKKGDTIVLSSSVIPGNERSVQKLKDNLSRQGAKIIHRDTMDVHASGHANRDETFWIHQKINPRFFMPLHGYHYMLRVHADIAKACGRNEDEIVVPDNGTVIEIQDEGQRIVRLKESAPNSLRLVDGFSIGDLQEVVIRDRTVLSQEGMFVIIATVNPKTGKLRKSPDIISRGFVYLRESQELLQQARIIVKKTIEDSAKKQNPVNFDMIKNEVTDTVARFLFEKTNKRPIVIPVVLGV